MSYVANKQNTAQLTNVHYWDSAAAAWSGNLVGAATPFIFLPNPVVANDLVLFGIDSTVLDAGPFCSLVFDLLTAITDVTSITWKYSNVAGANPLVNWAALTVQDNTNVDGAMTGVAFDTLGINSVHWEQDPLWVVQNPTIGGVALGITGLWVCAEIVVAGGAGVPPIQQNRDIYTVTWAHADTPEIGGDLAALGEIINVNVADADVGPNLSFTRLLYGSRLVSRGSDFTPYINLGNAQNHTDILISALGPVGGIVADITTATGWTLQALFPNLLWDIAAIVTITPPLERQYRGRFHVFLRAEQSGGLSGEIEMYAAFISSGVTMNTRTVSVPTASLGDYDVLDLGTMSLPVTTMLSTEDIVTTVLIYTRRTAGAGTFKMAELIVLPVDECALDVWTDTTGCLRLGLDTYDSHLDSIEVPKVQIRTLTYRSSDNQVIQAFDKIGNRLTLLTEEIQRHWFVTIYDSGFTRISQCENVHTVDMTVVQRYSSMRGAR